MPPDDHLLQPTMGAGGLSSQDQSSIFALLVASVRDYSIYVIAPDGRIASWNQGAYRIKGYTAEEIVGRPYADFFIAEDREAGRPARLMAEAARIGSVHDEGWRVRKDGSRFWASATLTALYDETNGTLRGYAKITHDETEKHLAAEELRRSEERFRLSIAALRQQAFYMLSCDGTVETWNPGAQLIKGYDAAEIIGRNFAIFFTPEDAAADKPRRELAAAAASGSFTEEGWRVRKDGSRFWAAVIVTAVLDDTGLLRGFAKVTRDETERHRAAVDLQAALERARIAESHLREHAGTLERRVEERTAALTRQAEVLSQANAELEQFAYIASHDLKEPLRMITSYLDLVRNRFGYTFDGRVEGYLDKINAAAVRMTEMVEAVLEYSQGGDEAAAHEPVDLNDVVEAAMGNLQAALSGSGADIVIHTLPTVRGNRAHLTRVFQNLLANAIKFRTERAPQVSIHSRPGGVGWEIAVQDNGIGIEAALHGKLFRIFQRLHSRDQYDGTGIGLASCRKILEHHGGAIRVESTAGNGATYIITLPRCGAP